MNSAGWKKVGFRRMHRERHQPRARKKLGLLEKKKDYKLRAQAYNKKKDTLRKLRQKAALRNPDEFYHKMLNAKLKDGVDFMSTKNGSHTTQQIKEMTEVDVTYLRMLNTAELRRVQKLQTSLLAMPVQELRAALSKNQREKVEFARPETPSKHVHLVGSNEERDALAKQLEEENDPDVADTQVELPEKLLLKRAKAVRELRARMVRCKEIAKQLEKLEERQMSMKKGPKKKVQHTNKFGDVVRTSYQFKKIRKK
ncbi:MAG: hypothetical protein MHM6MM_000785 [Cercozoa sp. M6MM]